jgi:hypothetical protein
MMNKIANGIGWIILTVVGVLAFASGAIMVNPQAIALILWGGVKGFATPPAMEAGAVPTLNCDLDTMTCKEGGQ